MGLSIAKSATSLPKKQSLPMNAGCQVGDFRDSGFRMRVLKNGCVFEIQGKTKRMKIESSDPDGVALQSII